MDESRKQFEESWLRRGGESSDLIRYPENHHEIGSGDIGGQYVMDVFKATGKRGRHREQLLKLSCLYGLSVMLLLCTTVTISMNPSAPLESK